MPRGDGTGPMGLGPMTGRAAGYCAGYPAPGFANPGPRMGLGWGAYGYPGSGYPGIGYYGAPYANPYPGIGLSPYYGMGYAPQVPPEQELQMLRDNSKALKEELERINQRISELEKEEKK